MEATLYVKIEGEQHRIFMRDGETLLEACNRVGVETPQSCLRGYCSTCKCLLEVGEAPMKKNLVLTDREIQAGYILACQAKPAQKMIVIQYD